jgi:hypothetical protein
MAPGCGLGKLTLVDRPQAAGLRHAPGAILIGALSAAALACTGNSEVPAIGSRKICTLSGALDLGVIAPTEELIVTRPSELAGVPGSRSICVDPQKAARSSMPMSEPHRSYRYAGSCGNRIKHSPANSPVRHDRGNGKEDEGQCNPGGRSRRGQACERMTDLSSLFTPTGYADRNPINTSRATGE